MSAAARIRDLIQERGPIPFSTFMHLALYGEDGYYTAGGGFGRDFNTSPDLSPVFGAVIAHQVAQCWDLLGRPETFDVVELGPGRGTLARSLLDALRDDAPACYRAVTYTLVEQGETLQARQRDLLAGHPIVHGPLPPEIRGVVLSNEFFDALPYEIVERRGPRLTERWVDYDEGFYWVYMPARPDFRPIETWLPEGGRTEVSLAAMQWMRGITNALEQGWHIAIDYARAPGDVSSTAATYRGGVIGADLLAEPGEHDITAQVDFETLVRVGETRLATLGLLSQRAFLRNLGWDAYIHGLQGRGLDPAVIAENEDRLRQIIAPSGLGGFSILVQATPDVPRDIDCLAPNPRQKERIAARANLRIPLIDGSVLAATDSQPRQQDISTPAQEGSMRRNNRAANELRPVRITPGYLRHAEGSAFIEFGDTHVLCAASIENRVPPFRLGKGGWLTAEYGMLPRSTHTRSDREASRGKQGGRTLEIQRLIGRSLRAVVNLDLLGERTITLDCDVIQADGGTRTAAITGAYIALVQALKTLDLPTWPVIEGVAAVSVGVVGGIPMLDLAYEEDSTADVDFNVVMTTSGRFVELQGTAEGEPFSRDTATTLIDLASDGIRRLFALQEAALASL